MNDPVEVKPLRKTRKRPTVPGMAKIQLVAKNRQSEIDATGWRRTS